MNKEGQAYSTFKLLIAAIVAMAILAILIPIIMQVMGWMKADPTGETNSLLLNLVASPGTVERTKEVTFQPKSVLVGSALADRVPISRDQICMSTGQFDEGSGEMFEWVSETRQQRILYHGNSDKVVKIAVVCNVNLTELEGDIEAYGLDYQQGNDILDACEICEDKGKCCAVVLERS